MTAATSHPMLRRSRSVGHCSLGKGARVHVERIRLESNLLDSGIELGTHLYELWSCGHAFAARFSSNGLSLVHEQKRIGKMRRCPWCASLDGYDPFQQAHFAQHWFGQGDSSC
jgi:hypothetical protein